MMFSDPENPELVELIPFGIISDKYSRKLFLFLLSFSMAASSGWIMAVGKICYCEILANC